MALCFILSYLLKVSHTFTCHFAAESIKHHSAMSPFQHRTSHFQFDSSTDVSANVARAETLVHPT